MPFPISADGKIVVIDVIDQHRFFEDLRNALDKGFFRETCG